MFDIPDKAYTIEPERDEKSLGARIKNEAIYVTEITANNAGIRRLTRLAQKSLKLKVLLSTVLTIPPVIKNPLITKNISTPVNPPIKPGILKW